MGKLEDYCQMASGDATNYRAGFVRALTQLQEWLDEQKIPFVLLGSVPISAYVDHGASAVFDRPNAHVPWQKVPDIDALVPRRHVPQVEQYARDVMGRMALPVHVDIADGYIDYRPDESLSYLTHRELWAPVPNTLLTPQSVGFHGPTVLGKPVEVAAVKTFDPLILLHMFVTVGCTLRDKDIPKITALAQAIRDQEISTLTERDCLVFHQFIAARQSKYPVFTRTKQAWETTLDALPDGVRKAVNAHVTPIGQNIIRFGQSKSRRR